MPFSSVAIDATLAQQGIAAVYVVAIVSISVIKFFKPLNNLLLYGKSVEFKKTSRFTDWLGNLTVPKHWFGHYYISLVVYLVALQYLDLSRFFVVTMISSPSVYRQLKLVQYCLFVQGVRRTIESYWVSKPGARARMNICHYALGMAHYFLIAAHTAISLLQTQPMPLAPTAMEVVLVGAFVAASLMQLINHHHLSTLVKYSVPNFWLVSCSHYLNEIEIYLVLAVMVCKQSTSNWMIPLNYVVCLVFVVVNLSISSIETHRFYQHKFPHAFKLKWSIIPGVL
jgi:3-oxo-5-alpha-steroid 4-dehydrogenase 3